MDIILNHTKESFDGNQMTIEDIIAIKNFSCKELIVRINGRLIEDEDFGTAIVKEGDNVEIIHIFHGG